MAELADFDACELRFDDDRFRPQLDAAVAAERALSPLVYGSCKAGRDA